MSPLQAFVKALNEWHARTLASVSLTAAEVQALADRAGLALDLDREVRRSRLAGVPSGEGLRCVRCRRKLQTVVKLNGAPFGRTCARREMGL